MRENISFYSRKGHKRILGYMAESSHILQDQGVENFLVLSLTSRCMVAEVKI